MKPFKKKISPKDVNELIDFGISNEERANRYKSMSITQSEGVAALYNILCENNFAYLADEVGMGKTYQALGLASILWSIKKDAKILVLCPRKIIQTNWYNEYIGFITNNYRKPFGGIGDDIVKSILLSQPIHEAVECENIWEFLKYFTLPQKYFPVIRHTSFRKVPVNTNNLSFKEAWDKVYCELEKFGARGNSFRSVYERPNAEQFTEELNLRFSTAVSSIIREYRNEETAIDLLIIDEAQYLRHYENNSNTNIRNIFNGNVKKWLYLSATPLHSGNESLVNTVNEYANNGDEYFTKSDFKNDKEFQKKIKYFLIRRPRTYIVSDDNTMMKKTEYRSHVVDEEAITVGKAIPSLSMAVIQKKLVNILEGQNNRFKIGFLSSFESLQDSVKSDTRLKNKKGDYDISDGVDAEALFEEKGESESDRRIKAPDDNYISKLTSDFELKFGFSMPHPKLHYIVNSIWESAFYDNEKYLIFVRRRSTVDELTRLFEKKYFSLLEERIKSIWKVENIWEQKVEEIDTESDEEYPSDMITDTSDNPFRHALQKGGWLYNYRKTFRGSGKSSLFFQEEWIGILAKINGLTKEKVIESIPESIWRESINYARRSKKSIYKARRYQYIITQLISRYPHIFGLNEVEAKKWKSFFTSIYPKATKEEAQDIRSKKVIDTDLFNSENFWEYWKKNSSLKEDVIKDEINTLSEDVLSKREILKNWLVQYILLSDSILDLYFSEKQSNGGFLFAEYFSFLFSGNKYAFLQREKMFNWIINREIILNKCFKLKNSSLKEYAVMGTYPELDNPKAIVGIKGGEINKTAIKQFLTPGYPQILICTDVLKEGENLHLFCDKVIHYGLAWTAGDLEQRVGRVDRYFSQVERKLYNADNEIRPNVKLNIYYPHLKNSLEAEQVSRVVRRQRKSELILDTLLTSNEKEEKELVQGGFTDGLESQMEDYPKKGNPFAPGPFNERNPLPYLSKYETSKKKRYYEFLKSSFIKAAEIENLDVESAFNNDFSEPIYVKVHENNENTFKKWKFKLLYVSELHSYALKGTCELNSDEDFDIESTRYSFEMNRIEGRDTKNKAIRIFLPMMSNESECITKSFIDAFKYLKTNKVEKYPNDKSLNLIKMAILRENGRNHVKISKEHKIESTVYLKKRKQDITVYLYKGMILLSSVIGDIKIIQNLNKGFDTKFMMNYNSSMSFGYLSIHREHLYFCERLFWNKYDAHFLRKIIYATAQQADIHEMRYLGVDR